MTGAELFVQCLREQGVEWVSALCGNGLNEVLAACHAADVRVIDTRNEQTAAYMADGWGRLSGRVGVCLVSSGVAHANAMTGVVNAAFDGSPMLLVTGAGPLASAGLGYFQDLDHGALAAPACKYTQVLDSAARIPEYIAGAFSAALNGRPGPVQLTFPMDVQLEDSGGVPPAARVHRALGPMPQPALVTQVVDLLAASQRPLLVAGSAAFYGGAEEALAGFAAAYGIPIMVPIWDRGTVPLPCPEFMGVIGAATGDPEVLEAADLLLLLGAEPDYRVGYGRSGAAGAKTVRIDVDPARLGRGQSELVMLADPAAALGELDRAAAARGLRGFEEWLGCAQQMRDTFMDKVRAGANRGEGAMHALDIVDTVRSIVPEDTLMLVDGGNVGQWFHQTTARWQYPGHWLTCGASGVIGFGIGGAMAARAGFPRRPVVLISGDGSATFNLTDLERAAHQELPFVMIIADDQRWGIVESGQVPRFGQTYNSRLGAIDFAAVAEGLGAIGAVAETPEQLASALHHGMGQKRPLLIHAPICGGIPAA
jgi:acetolactate synthase I/II/III large subunit